MQVLSWPSPKPKPSANPAHQCNINDTITLTASNLQPGFAFLFLNWNYFSNQIPGANTNIYHAVQPGIYSFNFSSGYCLNNPIVSDTVGVALGTVTLPNFSIHISDTTLCINGHSLMYSSLSGYTIYYERNGLPFTSSANSVFVTQGGIYSAYIKNNCDTVYSDTLHVNELPVFHLDLGSDTLVCINQNVLLDAGSGFEDYLWSTGDTTQTILVSGGSLADTLDYFVNVIDTNLCLYKDTVTIIFDLCARVPQLNNNYFLIFPNPSKDLFYFKNTNIEDVIIKIEINDLIGRKILTTDNNEINLSPFSEGIYFYNLKTKSGKSVTGKLIKQ